MPKPVALVASPPHDVYFYEWQDDAEDLQSLILGRRRVGPPGLGIIAKRKKE